MKGPGIDLVLKVNPEKYHGGYLMKSEVDQMVGTMRDALLKTLTRKVAFGDAFMHEFKFK